MPLTCEKKAYRVQVNPSEKLTGSARVLAGLFFCCCCFVFFLFLFFLTVTVNFLLLAVKWPKILVLAVTSTPPSRPSDKFLLITDNSFLTRDIKFQEKI